jgi:hypothetical protein
MAGTYERRIEPGLFPERVSVGVLLSVLRPELIDEVIEHAGVRERRSRSLPARLTTYFVLALWLFTGRNCGYRVVFSRLLDGLRWQGLDWYGGQIPADSSLARARARLGPDPLRMLFQRVAGPVGTAGTEGAFWRGLRVCSLDSTAVDVPDSAANQALGKPGDRSREGVLPQVLLVTLAESATGALLEATWDPLSAGGQACARRLVTQFLTGLLVLEDQDLPSWRLWQDATAGGAQLLWRVPTRFSAPVLEVLHDGTHLSELRPGRSEGSGAPVTVRVVEYCVETAEPDGTASASELYCLVTTLLDAEQAPAAELAEIYLTRWRSQTVLDFIKTDLAAGQPALRSRDPDGVDQEMWSLLCVYQAQSQLLGGVARQPKVPHGKISFEDPPPGSPRA